ncbi:unnamed protein product [Rhodiola kirilowii]
MGRSYGVKRKKLKNTEPNNDREASPEDQIVEQDEPHPAAKVSKTVASDDDATAEDVHAYDQLPGIPLALQDPNDKQNGVIFVLEKASLEVAKVGKGYQLLSAEDHTNFLKKNNKTLLIIGQILRIRLFLLYWIALLTKREGCGLFM